MRISMVSNAMCTQKVGHNIRKVTTTTTPQNSAPSFQAKIRWGGAIGGVVGVLAGVGLVALTGGAALGALLVPMAGGTLGAASGAAIDEELRPDDDDERGDFDLPPDYGY